MTLGKPSPLIAEFVGTFVLTFTVGCNGLEGTLAAWAPTSAACALLTFVYAFGEISGAYFNPAVNLAAALCGKLPWMRAVVYTGVQLLAALFAGFAFDCLYAPQQEVFAPQPGAYWWVCMVVEGLYTAMLVFVVLNVRASARNNPDDNINQFYGLAIGFVLVAGATVARDISGGVFNPAVAIGLDVSGFRFGVYWGFVYSCWHIMGAGLGALLFRLARPEEFKGLDDLSVQRWRPSLPTRLACEFMGTFMLTLSACLAVLMASPSVAWAVAAANLSMSYAVSDVSGGHFNPAVTLAVMLSDRGLCSPVHGIFYVIIQAAGAVLGALLATGLRNGASFSLAPKAPFDQRSAFILELVFTYFVMLVYLGTVTVPGVPSRGGRSFYYGLAVGMSVLVGTFIAHLVSGSGWLNPATSLGVAVANTLNNGGFFSWNIDILGEILAAGLAAGTFFITHGNRVQAYKKA